MYSSEYKNALMIEKGERLFQSIPEFTNIQNSISKTPSIILKNYKQAILKVFVWTRTHGIYNKRYFLFPLIVVLTWQNAQDIHWVVESYAFDHWLQL